MSLAVNSRQLVIRFIFIGIALVILVRLFFLQLFEDKYKIMANDIAIYRKVVYPPRGVIVDRKGKTMCYNEVVYDLMVTPTKVPRDLDTVQLCEVLGITRPNFEKLLFKSRMKNGPMRLCFVACSFPRTCSANSRTRFTYASIDSRRVDIGRGEQARCRCHPP